MVNFQINKTSEKSYSNNAPVVRKINRKNLEFNYPLAKLEIGQYHNGTLYKHEPIYSGNRERSLFANFDLKAGKYLVYAHIKFDPIIEEDFDVTLSTYSFYKCKINFATFEEAVDMSGNAEIDWSQSN